ncbi:MAG: hypothetical protein KGM24_14195 [Elusimicrobia bacterium]|nr:hypothetical protein [Elusimicrobiota bacterium]
MNAAIAIEAETAIGTATLTGIIRASRGTASRASPKPKTVRNAAARNMTASTAAIVVAVIAPVPGCPSCARPPRP